MNSTFHFQVSYFKVLGWWACRVFDMVTMRGLIDKCHRWVGFKNHQFVGMLASMLGGLSTHPSYDHTLAPLILLAPAQHTIKLSIHGHILLACIPRFNATSPRARFNTRGSANPIWNRNNPSRTPKRPHKNASPSEDERLIPKKLRKTISRCRANTDIFRNVAFALVCLFSLVHPSRRI